MSLSTPRQQLDQALAQLAAGLGLEDLALDEEGGARLVLDEVLVQLELDEAGERLILLAPLGEPEGDPARAYGRLLDANFFWAGTNGAMLAREPASRTIVLLRALPTAGLEGEDLATALAGFVDAAEALKDELRAEAAEPPLEAALPGAGLIRG